MKSKKFLAALAALTAVSAVATTGLTAKADEDVVVEVAPEVAAAPAVVEAPAAPAVPVVVEPVAAEPAAAPEPAQTVVTVDEPAAPAEEVAPADAAATEEAVDAEAATDVAAEDVTEAVPDAEAAYGVGASGEWTGYAEGDKNGNTLEQLAAKATDAKMEVEKKAAVDYKAIYQKYVDDEIVKKIEDGEAALAPDKTNPDKDYVRKELLGLVSVQRYDFGNDGVEELVAVTREQIKDGDTYVDGQGAADFMVNLFQYDRASDSTNLIGRQSLGTYDLTYAGFSRSVLPANGTNYDGTVTNQNYMGDRAFTEGGSMLGENNSQFQLAIVGDSIYFVQEQLTDIKTSLDDKDPNANRITHKIFTVDTKKSADFGDNFKDVYGTDNVGGAIANPYVLNTNKTTATEYTSSVQYFGTPVSRATARSTYSENVVYANATRYKKITGNEFADDYDADTVMYWDQQAATSHIREQFDRLDVPVNYLYLVDNVYNKDTIFLDVRFAERDVEMLMQYNTSPNFTTIDFTGNRGKAHPAGTSEKSGSSNGSSSSNGGATTSSPNTGDSRVPVAAGAAAVAAAAAAVAFVSRKRG